MFPFFSFGTPSNRGANCNQSMWQFGEVERFAIGGNGEKMVSIFLLLCFLIGQVEAQKRPNILLILADDLGYSDLDWHDKNWVSKCIILMA